MSASTQSRHSAFVEEHPADDGSSDRADKLRDNKQGLLLAYDLKRAAGDRVVAMRLNGKSIQPTGRYRIAINNFLASGGDSFSALKSGTDTADAGLDLDALEAWLTTNPRRRSSAASTIARPKLAERRLVEAAQLAAVEVVALAL